MRRIGSVVAVIGLAWSLAGEDQLFARQRKVIISPSGGGPALPVGAALPEGVVVSQPQRPPEGNNPQPGQPMPTGVPGTTPPNGATPGTGPKPVTRGDRPKPAADPNELKVRPDANGKVRFNFQGQPWLDVLEWLAQISNLSLDWQEVPGDQLNLATQRSYTVDEARDLINRHLLDRGYTLLRNGEVLTVANVKKLDPGMVARVRPEDLAQRDPHEFVKVSFSLDWLIAEQAVEELKPMLSQNGKLTALKTTNRVEAMDAVTNLREIYEVLREEQSRDGQEQLVREFQFKHVRASDVDAMLRELLGLPKANAGGGGGGGGGNQEQMQQMQQAMQQQMQQMQQMQQQGGQRPPGAGGGEKKVFLVLNSRRNSILAQAPADKMAVITQAVKTLDVENGASGSLLQTLNNTKIYRLAAIDPEPFVKVLGELGNLDPLTQIKVDRENQAIIVSGSLADHYVITELLKKLDGSDRRFEVIRLRRLESEYVAGTIEFMMGAGEKRKDEPNPFMGYMRFGLEMGGNSKKENKKFRVSADTENNRLLLWANELELKEVYHLLEKLGEVPPREGNPDTLRVFELGTPEAAEKLLEKLRRLQPGLLPAEEPVRQRPRQPAEATSQEPQARQMPRKPTPSPSAPTVSGPFKSAPEQQTVAPRQAGQSGRILQAGKPVPQVTLAHLQETPANEETESPSTAPPRLPPELQRRLQRLIEEHRAIMPTFAPEAGAEQAETDSDKSVEPAASSPPADDTSEEAVLPVAPPNRRSNADPVQVTVTEDGRLVIMSRNTQALDNLEDAINHMAPPRRDFKVFQLKNRNTWAYGVVLNLEKFFGTEKDGGTGLKYNPFFGMYPAGKEEGPRNLSKRRIPKFISDTDSRTILVTGADAEQLKIIQELIDVYDRPDETSAKALRMTKVFQLKYSKARVIADAVKEVYRDLLSSNDPALQQAQQNGKDQKPQQAERTYTYIYGQGTDDKQKEPEAPIKFKGLLSLGIDEISNTIVVSSQEGLLENVAQMITALDEAARPTQSTIQVLRVDRSVETGLLQSRLSKILNRAPAQPQQPQPGRPNQQPGQPPQQPANQAQVTAVEGGE